MDAGRLPPPVPSGLAVHRLRQVHGAAVLVVDGPGPAGHGALAPGGRRRAARGRRRGGAWGPGPCLAVLTADCAPVALGSPEGVHAAVHVGWRGLVAGVVEAAVDAMRALGASAVVAGLGPTIHPCCYAFGPADLDVVAAVAGAGVRAVTADGRPALDLPAAVGRPSGARPESRSSSTSTAARLRGRRLLAPGPRRRGPPGRLRLAGGPGTR